MARKRRAEVPLPAEAAPSSRRKRMTQEERSALSDRRMFEAAMALICEKGAHRTTLKEICERAGYSRGLANYRFGSKDAFFDQLIGHFNQAWKEHLQAHVGQRRGAEAIRAAIDAFESFLLEHGDYMRSRYIIMYESIATDNVISRKLRLAHRIYHNDLAEWVRQGIEAGDIAPDLDPDEFAAWYNAFIFGTVFQWLVAPEQVDVRRLCGFFRRQVERALAAPAGNAEG
ncbi:MAG: TetR family transcriptional regulator [Porticoccaceae bacterium]|nr:MAG: TetR family transcriptional regulator [Porticoccaceae bacterium]